MSIATDLDPITNFDENFKWRGDLPSLLKFLFEADLLEYYPKKDGSLEPIINDIGRKAQWTILRNALCGDREPAPVIMVMCGDRIVWQRPAPSID